MPKPRPQTSKKSGFKVGPRTAKNVYSGHQDKIKATLIHKAKVKKSYYKDLAAEGYGTGTNGGEVGVRGSGGKKGSNSNSSNSKTAGEDEDQMDEDHNNERTNAEENPRNNQSSKGRNNQPSTSSLPPTPVLPPKKPRLSSPEIAAIREKKVAERKEWGQRGARGQPKLGGRVEMLLNRIKKSMA